MGLAGTALAKTPREQAGAFAASAEVLASEGKFDAAAALFQRAYELDPEPVLLYNIARMHDRKGDLPAARAGYERYLGEETDPAGQERGRTRLTEVMERMPGSIEVRVVPADAVVEIDGQRATGLVTATPGTHSVAVSREGFRPHAATLEVKPGQAVAVPVDLVALPAADPVRPAPEPVPAPIVVEKKARPASRITPWQWVAIGGGAACVVVGGVLTKLAMDDRGRVDSATRVDGVVTGMSQVAADDLVKKARTKDAASWALYGVGGAAIVTGVVLAVVDATRGREPAAPAVGVGVIPGGLSFGLSGGF
jgi:hypothetical protein